MRNMKRFGNTRKDQAKKSAEHSETDIGAAVKVPLYVAATGLLIVYAWGAFESFPLAVGGALAAVFAMSELLKPKLGELAAEAMEASDKVASRLLLGACGACIALGATGGVIAMGAANAPHAAHEAATARLTEAQGRLEQAQARLDAVPTCTPEMPATRCEALTANNAATAADRQATRDEAKQDRDGARAALNALPAPGPGIPHVAMWQKAAVIAAIEFVLFAVPFACRRRQRPAGAPVVVREVVAKEPPKGQRRTASELARMGWQGEAGEKRRAAVRARYQRGDALPLPAH